MTATGKRPERVLRPDETFCPWCGSYFLDGYLFENHRPTGRCLDPVSLGWVRDTKGAWGYKKGSSATVEKPRRSHAQAAFDRLVHKLQPKHMSDTETVTDIEKVVKALQRDRDAMHR